MFRHSYFNLLLHTEDELYSILGSRVVYRQTLHEWPLSCVQEIRLTDGRRLVYKAQCRPSVEASFYQKARSPLLLSAQPVYRSTQHQALLLPFIESPTLAEIKLNDLEFQTIGREVCDQIAAMAYRRPVYLDLSSVEKWDVIASQVLLRLEGLSYHGDFTEVTPGLIFELSSAFRAPEVLTSIARPAVLCHGDLSLDNLFVLAEGGCKVIDWQRPFLGPPGLDWVSLLDSRGFDLPGAQDQGLVALYWLLRIAWLTACASRWFIQGIKTYDRQIAELAVQIAGLCLD